jgi:hypothetical protein
MWKSGGTVEVDVDANEDARLLVSAVVWLTVDVDWDGIRRLPPEIIR